MAATPLPGQAGTRRIGYARVSTADQDLAPQLDVLRAKGCEPIYSEHASGKHADRPELAQAMKALRAGDTLVVWRLDRLGRSLPDLIATVNELASRGIEDMAETGRIDELLFDEVVPATGVYLPTQTPQIGARLTFELLPAEQN